jgi:CRP-like cAMP-binding protein
MTPPTHNSFQNRLLAVLPHEDAQRFFSDLHPVSFPLQHVIYNVGAPLEHVYFIEQGLASILMNMSNGSTVEVGMIGREGMVGMPALLGALTSNRQFVAQSPITALRMNAALCKAAFDHSAAVRRVVLRFTEAILDLAAQTAACNRLHLIEQRCARWLLMSSDRIHSDVIPMTHEFLAAMLGVRRPGVTTTIGELTRSGLIEHGRGHLTISDREGLEATACECYPIDRRRLERLL